MEKLDSNQAAEFRRHHERAWLFDQGLHTVLPVVQVLWLSFALAALADLRSGGTSSVGAAQPPGLIYRIFHEWRDWLWVYPAVAWMIIVGTAALWFLSTPWKGLLAPKAKAVAHRVNLIWSVPGLAIASAGFLIAGASFALSASQVKTIGWECVAVFVPAIAWVWWRYGAFRDKAGPTRSSLVTWRVLVLVLCLMPFWVLASDWYRNWSMGDAPKQNAKLLKDHKREIAIIRKMLVNIPSGGGIKVGEKERREAQAAFRAAQGKPDSPKAGGNVGATPTPVPAAPSRAGNAKMDPVTDEVGDDSATRNLTPEQMAWILRLIAMLGGDLFALFGDGNGGEGRGGSFDDAAAERIASAINNASPEQRDTANLALKEFESQNPKLTPRINRVRKAQQMDSKLADPNKAAGPDTVPPAAESKKSKENDNP